MGGVASQHVIVIGGDAGHVHRIRDHEVAQVGPHLGARAALEGLDKGTVLECARLAREHVIGDVDGHLVGSRRHIRRVGLRTAVERHDGRRVVGAGHIHERDGALVLGRGAHWQVECIGAGEHGKHGRDELCRA